MDSTRVQDATTKPMDDKVSISSVRHDGQIKVLDNKKLRILDYEYTTHSKTSAFVNLIFKIRTCIRYHQKYGFWDQLYYTSGDYTIVFPQIYYKAMSSFAYICTISDQKTKTITTTIFIIDIPECTVELNKEAAQEMLNESTENIRNYVDELRTYHKWTMSTDDLIQNMKIGVL